MVLLAGMLFAGSASADGDECYVESSGSNYVETDYFPGPKTKIEVDFMLLEAKVQSRVFGVMDDDADGLSSVFYANGAGYFAFSHKDGGSSGVVLAASDTDRHTVVLDSYNGDVGYGVMDIKPQAATLQMVARDFYYPFKLPKAERPKVWDAIYHDSVGQKVFFPLP